MLHDLVANLRKTFGSAPETAKTTNSSESTGLLDGLESAVDKVRVRFEELRKESETKQQTEIANSQAEDLAQQIAGIHRQILVDIVLLHDQIQTGLTRQHLEVTAAYLETIDSIYHSVDPLFESCIHRAVVRRITTQCARLSWEAYIQRLEAVDRPWPLPDSLPPDVDKETLERAKARNIAEIGEAFLSSPPLRIARRMLGLITVWKANYPAQNSGLWQTVVLQAVGYGIFGKLLNTAMRYIQENEAALDERVKTVLNEQVEVLNKSLATGLNSLSEADRVLRSATQLCEELVPELAWQMAEPRVQQELALLLKK